MRTYQELKNARLQKGLTFADIERATGVDGQTIARIEQGKNVMHEAWQKVEAYLFSEQAKVPALIRWANDGYKEIDLNANKELVLDLINKYCSMTGEVVNLRSKVALQEEKMRLIKAGAEEIIRAANWGTY